MLKHVKLLLSLSHCPCSYSHSLLCKLVHNELYDDTGNYTICKIACFDGLEAHITHAVEEEKGLLTDLFAWKTM